MKKKEGRLQKGTLIYAMTLCICALALLVASARIQLSSDKIRNMETLPETKAEKISLPAAAPLTPKPTQAPIEEETAPPTPLPPVPLEEMNLILPVTGTVQKGFSGDSLVKSLTMRDWRVHNGIDITAAVGTEVLAATDGTVTDIFFDDAMGISIRVDHGNGSEALYQNLSTDTKVEVGQAVKKGDCISGVGDTASCEIKDTPHLHFVLLVNGKAVNPMDYIKEE